ncbi:hypothetical protein [Caldanaerobius polysaccharolyticus]|uniref:hypothetical protein n=1 Tax=Caldanaerobius polysaccharolyticus TaxID=44256 RepID=UPI00047D6227|nr:hypothetical protein [Caldanaerobius polysaccharolyticus]
MSVFDEIKELIENLKQSEIEKDKANEEMKKVIKTCIKEIVDIFLELSDYIKTDNIIIRSYMGKIFEIGKGIVVFDKSIEEKIVLRLDRKLYYYKVVNEELVEIPLHEENLTEYVSIDALFDSVKTTLIRSINKNRQQILNYRSLTAKINRYTSELSDIVKKHIEPPDSAP